MSMLMETLEVILLSIATVVPVLMAVAFYTLAERKIMAGMQRRRGPTEVGMWGLLQAFADGLKLLAKEFIVPMGVQRVWFLLAPISSFSLSFSGWMVSPSVTNVYSDLNYGVLLTLLILTLGVYGLIFAGWSSGSRYAFLGGVRAAAQMISYELVFTLVILVIAILIGSLNFNEIMLYQSDNGCLGFVLWPLSFVFGIVVLAETNRTPFDLPEAEAELVAGYNVEYAASPFSLFFLSEYCNMLLLSVVAVSLFMGAVKFFIIKVSVVAGFFIISRALVPRLRYDQLMVLGWKVLLPFSLGYSIIIFAILLL